MSATNRTRTGCLLVINVAVGREGSHNDAQNLKDTFEQMNADVFIKDDPGGEELKQIMDEFKIKDFSTYSYVAVAFLSHGTEDDIVQTATKELMKIQKTILFPLCRLPALDGKLKWLIMQTCKGSYDFIVQTAEGPPDVGFFPRYCAKFFATTEGMKAYRVSYRPNANSSEIRAESFFIRALCRRLRNEYRTHDILSIMNNVRDDVIEETRKMGFEQKPSSEDNFGSKKFYIMS